MEMTHNTIKRFRAPKSIYNKDCVMVAVQRYLEHFYVSIAEERSQYIVDLRSKNKGRFPPSEEEFGNDLIEAAFVCQRAAETKELRHHIIARALSPYRSQRKVK